MDNYSNEENNENNWYILAGPILESKGIRATFQKKGKKMFRKAKYLKFGPKCAKCENILKKDKW